MDLDSDSARSSGGWLSPPCRLPCWGLLVTALCGCATSRETAVERELAAHPRSQPASRPQAQRPPRQFAGGLNGYVTYALENNAGLRAAYERWRAQAYRISSARRLPEPELSFGIFVRSVETRVGPQQARLGLSQAFPWPSKLSAAADAASAVAHAEQRRFEAQSLRIMREVNDAYWQLWLVRRARAIHGEHLQVLRGLSETVRARFVTGSATLADQQQIDLSISRLEDLLLAMNKDERTFEAQLRASLGLRSALPLPTTDGPADATVPAASEADLMKQALTHPMIDSQKWMADSHDASARRAAAEGYPMFKIGADWIITGEADAPGVVDSGKDAVIVGGGMSIPLWQSLYDDSAAASRAAARSSLAEAESARDQAARDLAITLARIDDSARRVALHRHTLLPQAQAAYASVLGAYAVGRTGVAAALLSQQELLDLRLEQEKVRAEHSIAWARLEELVGARVAGEPLTKAVSGTETTGADTAAEPIDGSASSGNERTDDSAASGKPTTGTEQASDDVVAP